MNGYVSPGFTHPFEDTKSASSTTSDAGAETFTAPTGAPSAVSRRSVAR